MIATSNASPQDNYLRGASVILISNGQKNVSKLSCVSGLASTELDVSEEPRYSNRYVSILWAYFTLDTAPKNKENYGQVSC